MKNYLFAIALGATTLVATNAPAQVLSPSATGGTGGTASATQKTSGDFVAAALGQAPTSLTGQCAAEVKLFFGLLQYGHTLHAECLYQASSNLVNAGYVYTGVMLLQKAYNGGDQVYDKSLQDALQRDVDRIAQSASPSSDEMAKINQELTAIANQNRLIEERLSAIRTR